MDIETSELDLGLSIDRFGGDKYFGEIFLVEKLENGAGYCNYLSGRLEVNVPRLAFIDPLLPGGRLYEVLRQDLHAHECQGSCYDCMRDFHNQKYHSILHWRLGLDIAAIAASENYVPDFSQEYWKHHVDALCNQIGSKHKLRHKNEGCRHILEGKERRLLITHPLWSNLMIDEVIQELGGDLLPVSLFDAIRKVRL